MAYDKNSYEQVDVRLARALKEHPDMRVITENLTTLQDRQVSTWVVKTTIYLTADEQERGLAKSTGLAFEVDGVGMAQKTAALETAETSSIGRALANMGYSGSKRASQTEMDKADRGVTPQPPKNWLKVADDLVWKEDINGLRELYVEATRMNAEPEILEGITQRANGLAKS